LREPVTKAFLPASWNDSITTFVGFILTFRVAENRHAQAAACWSYP